MSSADDISGIADASRPNAGRIYDYLLGGNHNFEIDRHAAEQVLELAPFMRNLFRLIRWFLGEATRRLCDEGFRNFLDFASGLPTVDHIHQIAPEGTKVIYSDLDPVTAAYAQQIIGENPSIRYVQCDAGKPEELLNSGVVEELFGHNRKVAIGFNGIAWFLTDESVAHGLKVLYDWAAEGSKIFICDTDSPADSSGLENLGDLYKKIGRPLYWRTKEKTLELIGAWKIVDPGFISFEEWVDMDTTVTKEAHKAWGGAGGIAAILEK
jgi:SAM-dependent methyltransferase